MKCPLRAWWVITIVVKYRNVLEGSLASPLASRILIL